MGLTYRSQSLQDDEDPRLARWYFDLLEGVPGHEPPEVRGDDVLAPGYEGLYVGNRVNERQELLLEGFIRGFGVDPEERTADWHANSQLILAVFARDLSPGTLLADPGSNSYLGLAGDAEILARTIELMPGPITNRMSHQTWSIKLESIDNNWWQLDSS